MTVQMCYIRSATNHCSEYFRKNFINVAKSSFDGCFHSEECVKKIKLKVSLLSCSEQDYQ